MGLKEKLQADLTEAIRGRDEVKSGTIRMLLSAITNEEVAGKAAKVLTCLLYTSPSPRDGLLSRMPSSA